MGGRTPDRPSGGTNVVCNGGTGGKHRPRTSKPHEKGKRSQRNNASSETGKATK